MSWGPEGSRSSHWSGLCVLFHGQLRTCCFRCFRRRVSLVQYGPCCCLRRAEGPGRDYGQRQGLGRPLRATERGIHLTLSTEGAPEELSVADKNILVFRLRPAWLQCGRALGEQRQSRKHRQGLWQWASSRVTSRRTCRAVESKSPLSVSVSDMICQPGIVVQYPPQWFENSLGIYNVLREQWLVYARYMLNHLIHYD